MEKEYEKTHNFRKMRKILLIFLFSWRKKKTEFCWLMKKPCNLSEQES